MDGADFRSPYTWDVFLSYRTPYGCPNPPEWHASLKDKLEGMLATTLNRREVGVKVFLAPQEVATGAPIDAALDENLAASKCMLSLVSEDYFASPYCRHEWDTFKKRNAMAWNLQSGPGKHCVLVPALCMRPQLGAGNVQEVLERQSRVDEGRTRKELANLNVEDLSDFYSPGSPLWPDAIKAVEAKLLKHLTDAILLAERFDPNPRPKTRRFEASRAIVAFHSFHDRIGRSTAVANVARHLATRGRRVLVVDMDASGRGARALFGGQSASGPNGMGIMDVIRSDDGQANAWKECLAQYPCSTGVVAVLPPGTKWESGVSTIDWKSERTHRCIEQLGQEWKSTFDLVLVDPPSGTGDLQTLAGAVLPDYTVLMFRPGSEGPIASIAARAEEFRRPAGACKKDGVPKIVPVPCMPPSDFDEVLRDLGGIRALYAEWLESGIKYEEVLRRLWVPWVYQPRGVGVLHSTASSETSESWQVYGVLARLLDYSLDWTASTLEAVLGPRIEELAVAMILKRLKAQGVEDSGLVEELLKIVSLLMKGGKTFDGETTRQVQALTRALGKKFGTSDDGPPAQASQATVALKPSQAASGAAARVAADPSRRSAASISSKALSRQAEWGYHSAPDSPDNTLTSLKGKDFQDSSLPLPMVTTLLKLVSSAAVESDSHKSGENSRSSSTATDAYKSDTIDPGRVDSALRVLKSAMGLPSDVTSSTGRAQPEAGREEALRRAEALEKHGDFLRAYDDIMGASLEYQRAVAIRESLLAAEPGREELRRELLTAYERLADLLRVSGNAEVAEVVGKQMLSVRGALPKARSTDPHERRRLAQSYEDAGDGYRNQGRFGAASLHFTKALAIREELALSPRDPVDDRPAIALLQRKLGDVELAAGKRDEAVAYYRRAVETDRRMLESAPDSLAFRKDLGLSLFSLADGLRKMDPAQATATFEKARQVWQALVAESDKAVYGEHLVRTLMRVGSGLCRSDPAAAEQHYAEAVERARQLAEGPLKSPDSLRRLAKCLRRFGDHLELRGKKQQAGEVRSQGLKVVEELARESPGTREVWSELARSVLGAMELRTPKQAEVGARLALDLLAEQEDGGQLSSEQEHLRSLLERSLLREPTRDAEEG